MIVIATDSEFQSICDNKTRPICVALHSPGMAEGFFIHPRASARVRKKANEVGDPIFQSPFALFDYLGLEWKEAPRKCKNYQNFEIVIFWSFKDLEFLFAKESDYRKYVLPQLSRTRRISSAHVVETDKGFFLKDSISIPYVVNISDEKNKGKKRWYKVSVTVIDISAMQGNESLKNYACNVGIKLENKDAYTAKEKEHMEDNYIVDHVKFKGYTFSDISDLQNIRVKTVDFYNKVAELIGIEPRSLENFWGLSTGKIVGSMLHEWIAKQLNLQVGSNEKTDELYRVNREAGSESFTTTSKKIKDKRLIYLAMVDGGRAVKERINSIYEGIIGDADIDGCYGNGLRNQVYFVGTPVVINERLTLKQWLKKYGKQLVPGGWVARISWDNAPFKQDLLISKTKESFQSWDWVVSGFDSEGFEFVDDNKKVYDASMALTTNSIHQAALTHDSLQVIQKYASNSELNWLYDNAYIETSAIYFKDYEVTVVTKKMKEGMKLSDDINTFATGSKQWVRVELAPLMSLLINERAKHKKKTPMNTFLKLIINTIYGVIASEFFSVAGACVSNVVVGNNITSRARVLSWCMAKGFHSGITVTDGGTFDLNKVLKFKSKSLAVFEQLHKNKFTDISRHKIVEEVPLFNRKVSYEEALKLRGDKDRKKASELDKAAWNHLSTEFGELDIFKYNQFELRFKDVYSKATIHSKVDYRLVKPDNKCEYALRGMPKVWSDIENKKVIDPRADILFNAIEENQPAYVTIQGEELLSLTDWTNHVRKDELLPHDTVSKNQTFYSHTTHGLRYKDLETYKKVSAEYQYIKEHHKKIMNEGITLIKESLILTKFNSQLLTYSVWIFDSITRLASVFISEVVIYE